MMLEAQKSWQLTIEIVSQQDEGSIRLVISRTMIMLTYNSKRSFTQITYSCFLFLY